METTGLCRSIRNVLMKLKLWRCNLERSLVWIKNRLAKENSKTSLTWDTITWRWTLISAVKQEAHKLQRIIPLYWGDLYKFMLVKVMVLAFLTCRKRYSLIIIWSTSQVTSLGGREIQPMWQRISEASVLDLWVSLPWILNMRPSVYQN